MNNPSVVSSVKQEITTQKQWIREEKTDNKSSDLSEAYIANVWYIRVTQACNSYTSNNKATHIYIQIVVLIRNTIRAIREYCKNKNETVLMWEETERTHRTKNKFEEKKNNERKKSYGEEQKQK